MSLSGLATVMSVLFCFLSPWLTSANYPAALPQQFELMEAFEENQVTQKSICSPLVRSCRHATHSMPRQPLGIEPLRSQKKAKKLVKMNIMAEHIGIINIVTAAVLSKTFLNLIKWVLSPFRLQMHWCEYDSFAEKLTGTTLTSG